MISVEVLQLCGDTFPCGVTFALLLKAEKFSFLRIFVTDFLCVVQKFLSHLLCFFIRFVLQNPFLQLIASLYQDNIDCPYMERIYGQYSDFERFLGYTVTTKRN
jgi:hypothetical protein